MAKSQKKNIIQSAQIETKGLSFPVLIEKGLDSFYVANCPIFEGCFTQGKTVRETLSNIKEVIEMCLEEARVSKKGLLEISKWSGVDLRVVTL